MRFPLLNKQGADPLLCLNGICGLPFLAFHGETPLFSRRNRMADRAARAPSPTAMEI